MQPLIGCGMSPSPPPQSPLWSPNSSSEEESDNLDAELSDDPNSAPTFELSFDPDTAELSDDPGMDTAPTLELSDNSDKDTTPTPEPSDEAVEMHEEGFSSDYKDLAQSHIPHRYSKEMSAKSEVVSILTIIC